MARLLTAAMLAKLRAQHLRPLLFYEGEFASGTVRVWSGLGDLVWNGQTWKGLGDLGGISEIEETAEVKAAGIVVQLAGIRQEDLQRVLTDVRRHKPGKVWIGAHDDDGSIVPDPYLAFWGRLDVPEIEEGADTATIRISYESRLIDLERPREWRYTHESQQSLYAGDKGFQYVETLQDAVIAWGRR